MCEKASFMGNINVCVSGVGVCALCLRGSVYACTYVYIFTMCAAELVS